MNQHKDLLYRQKYATYRLSNRTFSTQNTKISARSLAISYICFQVRIVKKEKKKNILSTTTENLVTPAPPTPDKGSIREIATREITVSITPDDHLEGPYLLKTRELPGAPPPGTSVARGGGGAGGPPIMPFRSFVGTFRNLSVHVSRQACHFYQQNIEKITLLVCKNAKIF